MENSLKRFLSLALACLMVFSCVPVQAFATTVEGECEHAIQIVSNTATCINAGVITTTCDTCKTVLETVDAEPKGHSYDAGVCSACGAEDPDYVEPLNEDETSTEDEISTEDETSTEDEISIEDETSTEGDALVVQVQAMLDALPVLPAVVTQSELDAYMVKVNEITAILTTMTTEQTNQLTGLEKLYPMVTVAEETVDTVIDTEDELATALQVGGEVKLGGDITVDTKITAIDDTVIDLNDKTLYINVENSDYNNVIIKNGNIVLGKDDVHVCDGYFLVNEDKTLVLNDVNVSSAEGGIKGYAVFHLKTGANLDLINSELNISDNEYSAGYIVYAGEATATVDVTGTTITGSKVNGIVNATTVIDNSTFTITDAVEHGINRSGVTITDSNVAISGGTGRGITAQNGPLVINGNSNVTITDMGEATIELRGDQDLTVAETATVKVDVAVNNTTSGTVTGDVTVDTADNVTVVAVAKIGETPYTSLQAAIDAVQNGETIELIADVTEELVNIEKASRVAFTIDGKGNDFTGEFEIGIGETLTIQNVNFVASADISPEYFIDSMDQNSNCVLTIQNCTFTDTEYSTTAIGTHQPTKVVINGCTTAGVASLLQNQGGYNITVKNTTVEGKRGISLGSVVGATVENVKITAADDKYGIRLNGEIANNTITIKDVEISAFIPVVVRKAQVESYNVIFDGTNTMTHANTDGLWCAIGSTEYEINGTMPTAPTGKVTVTLNDTGLNSEGVYGNYVESPTGTITTGYVSEPYYNGVAAVWGEATSNAKESFVIELYAGTTKIATTTLTAMGAAGENTWHFAFTDDGDTAWNTVWEEGHPNKNAQPTDVKLIIDGTVVASNTVKMSAPDGVNPVVWTDLEVFKPNVAQTKKSDGTIVGYKTFEAAIAAAENNATVELISGDTVISMAGSVAGGKTVTITGSAIVDWTQGNLFVGRGGEGDGKVIFDGANITSSAKKTVASTGIHVSGSKGADSGTNDGVLVIKDSTIELDYLINRNETIVEGTSTLTIYGGIYTHGRNASESATGKDETATLTIGTGSTVNVVNENNMGVGGESNGIMTVKGTYTANDLHVRSNGTVNVDGGIMKITGDITNAGTVYVTGKSDIAANKVTGSGWVYMDGVTMSTDTKLVGAKVAFINGENTIVGSTIDDGWFSVGVGQDAAAATAAAFAEANGITMGDVTVTVSNNAVIGTGTDAAYSGWVGSAYSADKTQHKYVLNVENSLATFGYMHVSKDGTMNVKGHATNKYTNDNANVDFYAGDLIVNGVVTLDGTDAWSKFTKMSVDHADGVLNIENGTNFESSIHNGSSTSTSLKFWKAGTVNIDAASKVEIDNGTVLVDGAVLNIGGDVTAKGAVTGNGTFTLTDKDATFTAAEGLTVNVAPELEDYKLTYANGAYKLIAKDYVAQIGEKKFETMDEALEAVQNGQELKILKAGTYNVPTGKSITITGEVDGVVFDCGKNNIGMNSASVTFNNVTFNWAANGWPYHGLAHCGDMVYNNCTFNGTVFLYGTSETFNGCKFDVTGDTYNVWTYGAKEVAFNECTFNSAGKSVLVYSEDKNLFNDVTVTDCDFIASAPVDGKAAIEIDTSLTAGATITVDAATTATDFGTGNVSGKSLWNNKKGNNTDANNDITVVVAGQTVLKPVIFAAKIGETGYTSIADAIKAANEDETVNILAGEYTTDLSVNKTITVVGETDAEGNNLVNITGKLSITANGATVKNINVNNGSSNAGYIKAQNVLVEGCSVVGGNGFRSCYTTGTVTFRNSTITGSTYGIHFDGSAGGNIVIENCDITGWTSFASTIDKVTISDSKFLKGNYNQLRFYQNAEMNNVTFNPDMTIDFGKSGTSAAFNGCSVSDGSPLTDVIYMPDINDQGINVTIDGKPVVIEATITTGDKVTYYSTLAEAIAAAKSDDVIVLDKNVTFSYGAREAYGAEDLTALTINGNGHTLTLNQTDSDWGSIGLKNAEAKLVLNNMTIEKTGKGDTSGEWNTHAIIFSSNVEMTDVTVNNSVAVEAGAALNNVTINEAGGYYGLWINGNGQTVTVNGGAINATNGGRGIKIADEYVNEDVAKVTLSVTGTKFNTAKKAAILVSSTAGADITATNVDITNVAADSVNVAWVDEDWAAHYNKVTVNAAPAAQENVEQFQAAFVDENGAVIGYYKTLQAAIDACAEGDTIIQMLTDSDAEVTILQKTGINITIDGNGKTFTNKMYVNGQRNMDGAETLTIRNVNFETSVNGHIFIDANAITSTNGYAHNVTVEDCSFSASGAAKNTAVAMKFRQAKNITLKDSTVFGLHSAMQFYGTNTVTVEDLTATSCASGISLGTSTNVVVKDSLIKTTGADGYGIRVDAKSGQSLTVEDTSITAFIPVLVRNTTEEGFTLNVSGDNTMKASNTYLAGNPAWAVFSKGDVDAENAPVKPDVEFNLNLKDTGLDVMNVYPGFVASVGTEMYRSLATAIEASEDGDTVKLLADVELTETLVLEKAIALDTNNYVLTGSVKLADAGATVVGPEGMTVTTDITESKVVYEDGIYKVIAKTYVAQIGETQYETLAEAINAASAGNTITLLTDVTEDVTVSKSLTIDGANNKYTGNISAKGNANSTVVTIKNVNFENGTGYAVTTNRIKRVTIEDCSVKNYGFGFLYANNSTPTVVVKNVTVDGGNYGMHWVYGTSATLEDVTMTNVTYGLFIQNYADKTITVKNCAITSIYIWEKNGNSGTQTFEFEDANSVTQLSDSQYAKYKLANADATLTAPEGFDVITDDTESKVIYEDGIYKVVAKVYVAQIGETKYEKLSEAIEAASGGDTITLLDNVTEDVTVNQNLTIDGIKPEDGKFQYTGTMTVSDNKIVTIQNVSFVMGAITESKGTHGKLTVKNCDFDGVDKTVGYAITVRGSDKVVIENSTAKNYGYGMLYAPSSVAAISVKDVTVEDCSAAFNISYSGDGTFENVTLNNVTYGLHVQNYGARTFTIKNSELLADYPVYIQNKGTATVTFAFEGKNTFGKKGADADLNGYGKIQLVDVNSTLTAPEGLTVTTDVADHEVIYEDGKYSVVKYIREAQIGETQYRFLTDAIDAAKNGDTITLLQDINIEESEIGTMGAENYASYFVVSGKTITIDLDGKKISGTYNGTEMLVGVFSTDNYGHLTLTGNGTVDIMSGTPIEGKDSNVYALVASYEPGCTITIENGTYTLDKAIDCLIYCQIDEGVTVNGGTFTLGNVGTGENGMPWIFNVKGGNNGNVIVNGGTFNADISHQFWANEIMVPETKALKDNGNKTWTVVDAAAYVVERATSSNSYDRKIGYATLTEAIAAAKGSEVTLLMDVNEDVIIDSNVIIDLNDFTNKGIFTLKSATATLTADEGLTVITDVADAIVTYKDGAYKVVTVVAKNMQTDETYNTVEAALAAAQSGETVTLLTNAETSTVMIPAGVTLDLNGRYLEAQYAIVSFGHVIDTTDGNGGIKISASAAEGRTSLMADNQYFPIYDNEAGCYRFFNGTQDFIGSRGAKPNGDGAVSVKFGYTLYFTNAKAYELLMTDGHNVKVNVYLKWSDFDEPAIFQVPNSLLKLFAESAKPKVEAGETVKTALTLTVNGLQNMTAGEELDGYAELSAAGTNVIRHTTHTIYTIPANE